MTNFRTPDPHIAALIYVLSVHEHTPDFERIPGDLIFVFKKLPANFNPSSWIVSAPQMSYLIKQKTQEYRWLKKTFGGGSQL